MNFSHYKLLLRPATPDSPAVTLNYGMFLQSIIDFVIIAFAIFCFVRALNILRRQQEREKAAAPLAPTEDVILLREIRDLMKNNSQRL